MCDSMYKWGEMFAHTLPSHLNIGLRNELTELTNKTMKLNACVVLMCSWRMKLFVTPSRMVLLTGISLLGTGAFIAIVIALLHWRERVRGVVS